MSAGLEMSNTDSWVDHGPPQAHNETCSNSDSSFVSTPSSLYSFSSSLASKSCPTLTHSPPNLPPNWSPPPAKFPSLWEDKHQYYGSRLSGSSIPLKTNRNSATSYKEALQWSHQHKPGSALLNPLPGTSYPTNLNCTPALEATQPLTQCAGSVSDSTPHPQSFLPNYRCDVPLKNNLTNNINCSTAGSTTVTPNCQWVKNNPSPHQPATRVPIALGKGKFLLVKARHHPTLSQLSIPPRSPSRRIVDRNSARPYSEYVNLDSGLSSPSSSQHSLPGSITTPTSDNHSDHCCSSPSSISKDSSSCSSSPSSVQLSPVLAWSSKGCKKMPDQSVEDIVQNFIEKDLSILDAFGQVSESSRKDPKSPLPNEELSINNSNSSRQLASQTYYSSSTDSPNSSKLSQLSPSLDISDKPEKTTEKLSSEDASWTKSPVSPGSEDNFLTSASTNKKVRQYPSSINAGSPKSVRKTSGGVVDRFRSLGKRISSNGNAPSSMRSASSRSALMEVPDRGLTRTPTITMKFGTEQS
jgi:hypothetical protein